MKKSAVAFVAGVSVCVASGVALAQHSDHPSPASSRSEMGKADIVDTAVAAGKFKTLAAALKAAGLFDALKGSGPFTVFAPTDDAFAKLPAGTVEMLLKPENKDKLVSILTYHVVSGKVMSKDVTPASAPTLNGQQIDLKAEGGVTVDGAKVVMADVAASNGVIHAIDTVLMPSDKDIVTTAVDAGSFKTLAMLLDKAGLVDALRGKGPFTVFAPTDEAFAKLPKSTVEMLLKPENKEKLAAILKFHVVPGRVFAAAAAKGATAKTLEGHSVTTQSSAGKVMVENAHVLKADIDASNGVIHVIDTVVMPK